LHPPAVTIFREATKDDVLPLSKPLVTMSGESLAALPIPKGLRIMASVSAYNRYCPLWCVGLLKKNLLMAVCKETKTYSGRILMSLTLSVG